MIQNTHVDSFYDLALDIAENVPSDVSRAMILLKDAVDQGDPRAMYAIATWKIHGMPPDIEQDTREGIRLMKLAAKHPIAEALFDLAVIYDHGVLIRRNVKKAFSLYARAALLGDTESCAQLSQFYREGKTVDYDEDLAEAWLIRSREDEASISPSYRIWLSEKRRQRLDAESSEARFVERLHEN